MENLSVLFCSKTQLWKFTGLLFYIDLKSHICFFFFFFPLFKLSLIFGGTSGMNPNWGLEKKNAFSFFVNKNAFGRGFSFDLWFLCKGVFLY